MPKDLLFPSQTEERQMHKLKRLIQSPNSFFMDVKCPGCFHITTVFSNAQVCVFIVYLKLFVIFVRLWFSALVAPWSCASLLVDVAD